jgi:hypothetical protein
MTIERGLDDSALDALAASMDDANGAQSSRRGGVDVLVDDRRHVSRREGVEIDLGFDRYADWIHGD